MTTDSVFQWLPHSCDRGVTSNTTTEVLCLGLLLALSSHRWRAPRDIIQGPKLRPDFTQSVQIRWRSGVGNLLPQPRLLGFSTPQANRMRLNERSRQTNIRTHVAELSVKEALSYDSWAGRLASVSFGLLSVSLLIGQYSEQWELFIIRLGLIIHSAHVVLISHIKVNTAETGPYFPGWLKIALYCL